MLACMYVVHYCLSSKHPQMASFLLNRIFVLIRGLCLLCWFAGGVRHLDASQGVPGREKYNWGTTPISLACRQVFRGVFDVIMMDVEGPAHLVWWGHPWTGALSFRRNQAKQVREQASKKCSFMASTLAPASRFSLWLLCRLLKDGLWPECCRIKVTSFSSSSCLWSRCSSPQ